MGRTARLSPSALLMVPCETPICSAKSRVVKPVSDLALRSLSPIVHVGTVLVVCVLMCPSLDDFGQFGNTCVLGLAFSWDMS